MKVLFLHFWNDDSDDPEFFDFPIANPILPVDDSKLNELVEYIIDQASSIGVSAYLGNNIKEVSNVAKLTVNGRKTDGTSVSATMLDNVKDNITNEEATAVAKAFQKLVTYDLQTVNIVTTSPVDVSQISEQPGSDDWTTDDSLKFVFATTSGTKNTNTYRYPVTPPTEDDVSAFATAADNVLSGRFAMSAYVESTSDTTVWTNS